MEVVATLPNAVIFIECASYCASAALSHEIAKYSNGSSEKAARRLATRIGLAAAMLHRAFEATPLDKKVYSLGEEAAWHEALLAYLEGAGRGL